MCSVFIGTKEKEKVSSCLRSQREANTRKLQARSRGSLVSHEDKRLGDSWKGGERKERERERERGDSEAKSQATSNKLSHKLVC